MIDIVLSEKTKGNDNMYKIRNVNGHVQVYDANGGFLFSADSISEARKELEEYAKSAS